MGVGESAVCLLALPLTTSYRASLSLSPPPPLAATRHVPGVLLLRVPVHFVTARRSKFHSVAEQVFAGAISSPPKHMISAEVAASAEEIEQRLWDELLDLEPDVGYLYAVMAANSEETLLAARERLARAFRACVARLKGGSELRARNALGWLRVLLLALAAKFRNRQFEMLQCVAGECDAGPEELLASLAAGISAQLRQGAAEVSTRRAALQCALAALCAGGVNLNASAAAAYLVAEGAPLLDALAEPIEETNAEDARRQSVKAAAVLASRPPAECFYVAGSDDARRRRWRSGVDGWPSLVSLFSCAPGALYFPLSSRAAPAADATHSATEAARIAEQDATPGSATHGAATACALLLCWREGSNPVAERAATIASRAEIDALLAAVVAMMRPPEEAAAAAATAAAATTVGGAAMALVGQTAMPGNPPPAPVGAAVAGGVAEYVSAGLQSASEWMGYGSSAEAAALAAESALAAAHPRKARCAAGLVLCHALMASNASLRSRAGSLWSPARATRSTAAQAWMELQGRLLGTLAYALDAAVKGAAAVAASDCSGAVAGAPPSPPETLAIARHALLCYRPLTADSALCRALWSIKVGDLAGLTVADTARGVPLASALVDTLAAFVGQVAAAGWRTGPTDELIDMASQSVLVAHRLVAAMAVRGGGAMAEAASRAVAWPALADALAAAACACAAGDVAFARPRAPTLSAQCVNLLNLLLQRGPEYLFGTTADYHAVLAAVAARSFGWQRLEAAVAAAGWLAPTPVYVPSGASSKKSAGVRSAAPRTAVLRLTNVRKVASLVADALGGGGVAAANGAHSASGTGDDGDASTTNAAAMLMAVKTAPLGMMELFPFDRLDAAYALEAAAEGEGAAEARASATAARLILAGVRDEPTSAGVIVAGTNSAGSSAPDAAAQASSVGGGGLPAAAYVSVR